MIYKKIITKERICTKNTVLATTREIKGTSQIRLYKKTARETYQYLVSLAAENNHVY